MTDPRVAFEAWMKTRALCLTLDASVIDMEVERYMSEAWQAAIKHEREMPASYDCSTLISEGKGAAVTFHFGNMDEAIAWHEKVTPPPPPVEGQGLDG